MCPDSYGTSPLVSKYPNFYEPYRCGGISGQCVPAKIVGRTMAYDIVAWFILNLIILVALKRRST